MIQPKLRLMQIIKQEFIQSPFTEELDKDKFTLPAQCAQKPLTFREANIPIQAELTYAAAEYSAIAAK